MPGSLESNTKIYNVLFVDDRRDILNTLELMDLEHYEFHYAPSGRIALNLLKEHYIDLCIVDYKMPEMDGLTLIEKINKKYSHIPIIMLTAYATVDLYKKVPSLEYDACYVLEKHEDVFEELIECMDKCVNHGGMKKFSKGLNHYRLYRRRHGIQSNTEKIEQHKKRLEDLTEAIKKKPYSYSCQQLAQKFKVTKQQIWLDIQELKKEGKIIKFAHGKGYFLASE